MQKAVIWLAETTWPRKSDRQNLLSWKVKQKVVTRVRCHQELRNDPTRKQIITFSIYYYCAFAFNIRFQNWGNEEDRGIVIWTRTNNSKLAIAKDEDTIIVLTCTMKSDHMIIPEQGLQNFHLSLEHPQLLLPFSPAESRALTLNDQEMKFALKERIKHEKQHSRMLVIQY